MNHLSLFGLQQGWRRRPRLSMLRMSITTSSKIYYDWGINMARLTTSFRLDMIKAT